LGQAVDIYNSASPVSRLHLKSDVGGAMERMKGSPFDDLDERCRNRTTTARLFSSVVLEAKSTLCLFTTRYLHHCLRKECAHMTVPARVGLVYMFLSAMDGLAWPG
jgi:hypothetical protein